MRIDSHYTNELRLQMLQVYEPKIVWLISFYTFACMRNEFIETSEVQIGLTFRLIFAPTLIIYVYET